MVEIIEVNANKRKHELVSDPIQRIIYRHIFIERRGCLIGITGRAGFGKTYTANKIIKDWDPEANPEDYLCHSIEEAFEKILLGIKVNGKQVSKEEIAAIPEDGVIKWCKENIDTTTTRIGRPFLIDEAGVNLYNRNFFSSENKAMSQFVQIWRYMRMLVIFIVAEKFSFMEKTMLEFLDIQIIMTRLHREEHYAESIVKERYGRTPDGSPAFKNIIGCRERGHINIVSFDVKYPNDAEKYNKIEETFKYALAVQKFKDLNHGTKAKPGRKAPTIEDIEKHMVEARKIYKDKLKVKGKDAASVEALVNNFKITWAIARRLKYALDQEIKEGKLT